MENHTKATQSRGVHTATDFTVSLPEPRNLLLAGKEVALVLGCGEGSGAHIGISFSLPHLVH
jgi:hypothetical protein